MKIMNANVMYLEEAVEIAFAHYKKECKYTPILANDCKEEIAKEMTVAFQNGNGYVCVKDGKLVGYLLYDGIWNDDGKLWCNIPLWGCGAVGANRGKIISLLFQVLAEKLFEPRKLHFEIKLYAHDEELLRLFSFLQFGIQCEEAVRAICDAIEMDASVEISELSKEEISARWKELWVLLEKTIGHLQKSPVFYPGTEFTENVYKEFVLESLTRVVVAKVENQVIGVMLASKDGNSFINNYSDFYNVGDVYVEAKHRGKALAQNMLAYMSNLLAKEGVERLWVEHGTANPNARGFWNKYFMAYSYTMIREIESF